MSGDKSNKKNIKKELNTKISKNILFDFCNSEKTSPEQKLTLFFSNKKIYIDIYNGEENCSKIYYDILSKYNIIECKKLINDIDYIIFKDGHLKTKKYACLNNIKIVNPLWVDDKINKYIFKNDNEYEIKLNFSDIILKEKIIEYEKEEKKK